MSPNVRVAGVPAVSRLGPVGASPAILIQVPTLRKSKPLSKKAAPRRRLRKEFRLGALVLLIGIPALAIGWQLRAPSSPGALTTPQALKDSEAPVVSLSVNLEPLSTRGQDLSTEEEKPVLVNPLGYVLPEVPAVGMDVEERNHAGG